LKAVVVSEDSISRSWASQFCDQLSRVVGSEGLSVTWWAVDDLAQPEISIEAIRDAIEADLIIVSARTEAKLPLELRGWIDGWRPCRRDRPGTIVALVGAPEEAGGAWSSGLSYLQAVAREAGLSYLRQDRWVPESGGKVPGAVLNRVNERRTPQALQPQLG
jgi:hypothetical protein